MMHSFTTRLQSCRLLLSGSLSKPPAQSQALGFMCSYLLKTLQIMIKLFAAGCKDVVDSFRPLAVVGQASYMSCSSLPATSSAEQVDSSKGLRANFGPLLQSTMAGELLPWFYETTYDELLWNWSRSTPPGQPCQIKSLIKQS
jgi:hypothetical protein